MSMLSRLCCYVTTVGPQMGPVPSNQFCLLNTDQTLLGCYGVTSSTEGLAPPGGNEVCKWILAILWLHRAVIFDRMAEVDVEWHGWRER
jgi:hypothetical protein